MNAGQSGSVSFLKDLYQRFSEDECPMMASSLAYYTIFSLPALLVIVIAVAGLVWGEDAVRGRVGQELKGVVGNAGVAQLDTMVDAASKPKHGVLATVVGIAILLVGATGAVVQLQYSLNKIWRVKPDPRAGGVWPFIYKRILSFAMILTLAFLMMVSLLVTTALSAFGEQIGAWLPKDVSKALLLTVNFGVSFLVLASLFAAMFKWLPDARIRWRDVALGAILTAALFMVGKFLLGLYLGALNPNAYGPAAALVLILIWAYYSAMILFAGAEFTEVWARRSGRPSVPTAGAVRIDAAGNVYQDAAERGR